MDSLKHFIVTSGAGYIGSLLTGNLLLSGYAVTVVDDGIRDVQHALRDGVINNPHDNRYRNAQFIVQ